MEIGPGWQALARGPENSVRIAVKKHGRGKLVFWADYPEGPDPLLRELAL